MTYCKNAKILTTPIGTDRQKSVLLIIALLERDKQVKGLNHVFCFVTALKVKVGRGYEDKL